jgi:predicted DNA-binding protein YlxM (UPF0122 family)
MNVEKYMRFAKKAKCVEEEYQTPFWEVVQDYANHGYSGRAVAGILEIDRKTIYDQAKKHNIVIKWPAPGKSRFFLDAFYDPAERETMLARRKAAHKHRQTTYKYEGKAQTLEELAALAGTSKEAMRKRIKRRGSVEAALQNQQPLQS